MNLLLKFPFLSRVPSYVELLIVKKFVHPFVEEQTSVLRTPLS